MARSVPQIISLIALLVGIALLVATLYFVDVSEIARTARRLGAALPVVLAPSLVWHVVRTTTWALAFPPGHRVPFARLFRVRLAADGVAFLTVRGLAGEPLKVLLLYDRVPAAVTTAALALERIAVAVVSLGIAGGGSAIALLLVDLGPAWEAAFRTMAIACGVMVALAFALMLHRGRYLAPLFAWIARRTGGRLGHGPVARFLLQVEAQLLSVAHGDRRRLWAIAALSVLAYALLSLEVWLVFWAIGAPVRSAEAFVVETFARASSIVSAAIPANIGALEASSLAVTTALGLAGGGSLALARRIRHVLWAAVGLALYPRGLRNGNGSPGTRGR